MATKFNATLEAVKNADRWMNGAVVVEENGEYYAIPGAYLEDISYEGSRNVVIDIRNGLDDTGYTDCESYEGMDEDIANLLIDNA